MRARAPESPFQTVHTDFPYTAFGWSSHDAYRPDESVEAKLLREASWSPLPHYKRASPPTAYARQQPDQPLVHVAVHLLKLPGGVPRAEVVAPATQDGIEDLDDLASRSAPPWAVVAKRRLRAKRCSRAEGGRVVRALFSLGQGEILW